MFCRICITIAFCKSVPLVLHEREAHERVVEVRVGGLQLLQFARRWRVRGHAHRVVRVLELRHVVVHIAQLDAQGARARPRDRTPAVVRSEHAIVAAALLAVELAAHHQSRTREAAGLYIEPV